MKRTIKELSRQRSITTMDHMDFSICTTWDGTNFLNFTAHNPIPVKTHLEISRCSLLPSRKSCFGPVSTLSMTASQWQVSTKQKEANFFSESGVFGKATPNNSAEIMIQVSIFFSVYNPDTFLWGLAMGSQFLLEKIKENKSSVL